MLTRNIKQTLIGLEIDTQNTKQLKSLTASSIHVGRQQDEQVSDVSKEHTTQMCDV